MLGLEEAWRRYDAVEGRLSGALSERMLDLAGVGAGMRVLDVATGRGEPALRASSRVGAQGAVVGVDASAEMLGLAREAAERAGVTNLELRVGNAEVVDLPRNYFHAATLRWGLMYMNQPVAALTTIRRALRSDGVFVAAVWAEPERASFFTAPRRALQRHRPVPALDPEAPGPFHYFEGETGVDVVAWVRALGFGIQRLLNELPQDAQEAWEQDLAGEMERSRTGPLLTLSGITRIARAHPT